MILSHICNEIGLLDSRHVHNLKAHFLWYHYLLCSIFFWFAFGKSYKVNAFLCDWLYTRWLILFCPLFCYVFCAVLSKQKNLNFLVSLHGEVCIDFNFIYHLLLSLSLKSLSHLGKSMDVFVLVFFNFLNSKVNKLPSIEYVLSLSLPNFFDL